MAWHQIYVTTTEVIAHSLADYLTDLGAVAVTMMDAEDRPVYEPPINTVQIWEMTVVSALFELEAQAAVVKALVIAEYGNPAIIDWQQEILEDKVWERQWLDYFQPTLFANKLWVCPSGMEKYEPDTVCMTLDPGLAFGTGTHPTTALCLEWLASNDLRDKTVIDYGCGSGILGVAALLLGAKVVHAIDIDPQALTATLANAEKNQVSDKIECYLPEQFIATVADIVIANILAGPLIELATTLSPLVKFDGKLVLSGILSEQANNVSAAYHKTFILDAPVIREEWCRIDGYKII